VPGGRDRGELLRVGEQLDRVGGRGRDGVLALDEEQPELLAPAALVQLPDEVGRHRGDATLTRYIPLWEYVVRAPLGRNGRRLQRDRRAASPRDPRHAARRGEGGRDDRDRPLAVPAPGLEAPAGAQRGGARAVPCGRPPPAVQPRAGAPAAVPRVADEVRADAERA